MMRLLKALCIAAALMFIPAAADDGYEDNSILISAEEAIKLIGNPNVMFVSGDNPDVYQLGHIKGSVEMYAHHLHHSDLAGEMHCKPLFRCIDDAEHYIGSKGISNETMIIAYDDFKGPNATGVYFFFKSYGHTNIKILNGGRNAIMELDPAQKIYNGIYAELKAEKKVGKKAKKTLEKAKETGEALPVEAELKKVVADSKIRQKEISARLEAASVNLFVVKGDEHVEAKTYHINKDALDYSYIAGKEEVKTAMEDILKNGEDSKYVIVDTRAMSEIIGERKMDNVARGGHIPGATLLEWKKVSDLDRKLSFRKADELKKVFAHYNITPDKTVYAYCQVGAGRSTEIITALKLLGYKNVKAYSGSWDEWGNDMSLPLKR
ncbi:MAG: rhodanese-like domain-containing protein [Campylobacterota bacterium]|nr:rhodanese-like domain-containing protein [Campylobacterota bacterium]